MLAEIERFLNWMRRRNPEARTWRDYGYDLKQFAEVIGDAPPATVTFHDVDRFVTWQAGRGFQPATINRRRDSKPSKYSVPDAPEGAPTLPCCPSLPPARLVAE